MRTPSPRDRLARRPPRRAREPQPTRSGPKKRRIRCSAAPDTCQDGLHRSARERAPARAAGAPREVPAARPRRPARARGAPPGRCRRGRARRHPPGASPACATPAAKSANGLREARRDTPRDRLDLPLELGVDARAGGPCPGRASRSFGRRAWARGRPERMQSSASSPSRTAPSSSLGPISDDQDRAPARARGGSAHRARKGPFASRLPPRTSSLPVTTTIARGRSAKLDHLGGREHGGRRSASRGTIAAPGRLLTVLPFSFMRQASRVAELEPQAACERSAAPGPARACPSRAALPATPPFTHLQAIASGRPDEEAGELGFGLPVPAGCDPVVVQSPVDAACGATDAARRSGREDVPSPKPKATTTSTVMATIAASATTTKFDSTRGVAACVGRRRLATRDLLDAREARVVLVDVELPVEPEIVGVRAQEPLHVRVAGQHLEAAPPRAPEVLSPDLRVRFDPGEVSRPCRSAPRAGCCRSRTRAPIVAVAASGSQSAPLLSHEDEHGEDPDREGGVRAKRNVSAARNRAEPSRRLGCRSRPSVR